MNDEKIVLPNKERTERNAQKEREEATEKERGKGKRKFSPHTPFIKRKGKERGRGQQQQLLLL